MSPGLQVPAGRGQEGTGGVRRKARPPGIPGAGRAKCRCPALPSGAGGCHPRKSGRNHHGAESGGFCPKTGHKVRSGSFWGKTRVEWAREAPTL